MYLRYLNLKQNKNGNVGEKPCRFSGKEINKK